MGDRLERDGWSGGEEGEMSGTAATLALAVLVGWPLARMARAAPGPGARAGLALLLGLGVVALLLFLLSALGIPWSRMSLLASAGLATGVAWLGALRTGKGEPDPLPGPSRFALPFLALAAILVAGHGMFATAAPRSEADFLEIWGLKGRVFYESRGVDWEFLAKETTFHNHPDYPPLLPLLFASAAVLRGGWEDPELGLFFTAFGAALLLIAEGSLRRRHGSTWLVGPAMVALAPLALSPWIGIAEGPLLAYGAAAVLLIRDGIEEGSRRAVATGGVLLGLAALTKNEGIAMIVTAAVILLLISREARRYVVHLWPAAALASLWIVPSLLAGLESDLVEGDPAARLAERLRDPWPLLGLLASHTGWRPLFWLGLAAGALATLGRSLRAERLLLGFVLLQTLLYLAAYAITPHELAWHVRWSWERLVSHVAFLLAAAILSAIIGTFRGRAIET
jgi:hypothetical protein